jgi:hypothetical protein
MRKINFFEALGMCVFLAINSILAVCGGDDVITNNYNTYSLDPVIFLGGLLGLPGYVFGLVFGFFLKDYFFNVMEVLNLLLLLPCLLYITQTITELFKKT